MASPKSIDEALEKAGLGWKVSHGDVLVVMLQFEVGRGEVAPDARFEPHGHVLLINVSGLL